MNTESNSSFIATLPNFSVKKLITRFSLSLISFLICYFGLRFLSENFFSLDELSPITKYFALSWLFYIPAVITSIICFYPQMSLLKIHFSSLSVKNVIKDTSILILISFSLSLLLNIVYFTNPGKSEISNLLANYNGLANFFSLNIFYFSQWVLVGVSEEIIFRAGIYRGLRSVLNKYISLIVAALIFVLMHELHFISSTFVFFSAIIAAIYFEKRNNLIPLILLHILQDMYIAGTTLYLSAYIVSLFV